MEEQKAIAEKEKRIYLCCAIIIIAIIAIFQFVLLLYDNDELSKQFSFASTITSIILSVIAVIMTVVSGESINSLLHKFRDLYDEIRFVPTKIDTSVEKMESFTGNLDGIHKELQELPPKIVESSEVMKKAAIHLDESVEKLLSTMVVIQDRTDDLQLKVSSLHNDVKEGFANSIVDSTQDKDEGCNGIYKSILTHGSYWGNCLIYAAHVACDKNSFLDLMEFSDVVAKAPKRKSYFLGYFVMLIAVKVIEVNRVNDAIYKIIKVNIDKKSIEDFMLNFINENEVGIDFTDPKKDIETINHLFG